MDGTLEVWRMRVVCGFCGTPFDKENKEYNRRFLEGYIDFFCTPTCAAKFSNRKRGCASYPFSRQCLKCQSTFIISDLSQKQRRYCSKKCAHSRTQTEETKRKISKKVSKRTKELWKDPEYVRKQMSIPRRYTSVGEVKVREFFMSYKSEDEWTFGGVLTANGYTIARDLYSNKLKVCIEYDGIWHFKDINGQLQLKQAKDIALEKWCLENNWRLIRIRDELFHKNEDVWLHKLVKEAYCGTEPIVKFY